MRLSPIIFFFLFIFPIGLQAQEADQKIAVLLNQSDWFALDEEYPKVKNQIQTPIIRGISEVMLNISFNQQDKALLLIDSLLTHYQEELGFENISSFILFKNQILREQGYYAKSADNLHKFLEHISDYNMPKESFPAHLGYAQYCDALRNEQKPEIIRPKKNTKIPISIEKVNRGNLIFIPVVIRGKVYRFIFDTGAEQTFVSEQFANEVGLRTILDSVAIAGVGSGFGKIGTIDSITIGDIVFKHPIITIARPNPEVDTMYQIDAVLGLDFIKRIGETQIFPEKRKIVFPYKGTKLPKTGRNLLISFINRQSYLKAFSGNERLIVHFDTGNVMSDLFDPYYTKHKKYIDSTGIKDTVRYGGFGAMKTEEAFILSKVPLQVGSVKSDLSNIAVHTEKTTVFQHQEDGSLGMSFITMFKKTTINFDKMFVEVEK